MSGKRGGKKEGKEVIARSSSCALYTRVCARYDSILPLVGRGDLDDVGAG